MNEQEKNRIILQAKMEALGFTPLEQEMTHLLVERGRLAFPTSSTLQTESGGVDEIIVISDSPNRNAAAAQYSDFEEFEE